MKTKNKLCNFNLLIFLDLISNQNGVARVFLNKLMVKQISNVIKKNHKLVKSQLVKELSDFLKLSDDFFKIQLNSEFQDVPINLLDDLAFILIENFQSLSLFLKNKEKEIIILTLMKNSHVVNESDWIIEHGREFVTTKTLSKVYGLNVIAFHEPEAKLYELDTNNKNLGKVKIFVQNNLLQTWINYNDLSTIFSDLKKERIFNSYSFNYNATLSQISNNAMLNMAQLIYKNLATIKQAADKFPDGLILQFDFDEHEQFKFVKIIRW